jgi:hypothetical protein
MAATTGGAGRDSRLTQIGNSFLPLIWDSISRLQLGVTAGVPSGKAPQPPRCALAGQGQLVVLEPGKTVNLVLRDANQ